MIRTYRNKKKLGSKAIEKGAKSIGIHREYLERRAALRRLEEANKAMKEITKNK